jgi:electron transport complex protein RnfG
MNELAKMVIVLAIITVIATALLSVVNSITKPIIDKSRESEFQNQMREIFPSLDSTLKKADRFEVYQEGKLVGYAVLAEAKGYSSTIMVLVGVTPDNKIKGVTIIDQQETPGLGTRIAEKQFLDQFVGKPAEAVALRKDGGAIDGIIGATVSSRALTNGVKTTVERLAEK